MPPTPAETWTLWTAVGFVGQVIFGLRFVVQWIASERKRRSVVPVAFWYLSLLGTVILLTYAIYLYFIHRRAPVRGEADETTE